jgi:TfoX/Sxy family transcriptional regulator of competence genes
MNDSYRDELKGMLDRAIPRLASTHELSFKGVFGAVGGYIDGKIFVSCGNFGIALRLPPTVLEVVFRKEGVTQLRYFSKWHIKKEYAVLPTRILEADELLTKLVDESMRYASGR